MHKEEEEEENTPQTGFEFTENFFFKVSKTDEKYTQLLFKSVNFSQLQHKTKFHSMITESVLQH